MAFRFSHHLSKVPVRELFVVNNYLESQYNTFIDFPDSHGF